MANQKKWHILFCDEIEQACPVTKYINDCQPVHQVKILRILYLLEEQGPILPRPYADILGLILRGCHVIVPDLRHRFVPVNNRK